MRRRSPYPVRTVLPLTVPEGLAAAMPEMLEPAPDTVEQERPEARSGSWRLRRGRPIRTGGRGRFRGASEAAAAFVDADRVPADEPIGAGLDLPAEGAPTAPRGLPVVASGRDEPSSEDSNRHGAPRSERFGADSGWVRAEIQRRIAATRSRRGRHARPEAVRGSDLGNEAGDYVPRHSVQAVGPAEAAPAYSESPPPLSTQGPSGLRSGRGDTGSGGPVMPRETPAARSTRAARPWIPPSAAFRSSMSSPPTRFPPARGLLPSNPPERWLVAHLSERVPVGGRLSLIVSITSSHPTVQAYAAPLKPFTIPPGGTNVTVVVSVPGLRAQGDLEQDLWITLAGNPEPIRFSFVAERIGLHTATVQAYRHGTFLAELHAQVSVDVNADVVEGTPQVAQISALAAEPGEVTLQVSQTDDGRYSFQLLGEALHPPELTRRLAGDPTAVVDEIVAELRSMAAGSSAYSTSSLVRRRLKNLGTQLWQAVVPEAIQRQFWDQVGQIKTFTVASDRDILPWELLYPLNENLDNGFLVDQFPVVRRVYGQGRARGLRVGSAAYVVPPGSPENAHCEVQAIQTRLNGLVVDRGILARLDEMIATLEAMPSLLHFACHNTFSQHSGSSIMLEGGPLRPTDLSVAVQTRSMAAAGPLGFNACRTAAEAPWLAENLGWAKQFMRAGAGAFVGSLWAVRSSAAQAFAESFYDALVVQGLPLGEASLAARRSTTDQAGDPTRLAYTIYGNPAATAMSRMETP